MAHTSGTVSAFSGSNGLLQKLLDFVLGTIVVGESWGSCDGSKTAFSGTAAHHPVAPGRLTVHYTIGGTSYAATDDGAGEISGDHVSSGAINYASGEWSMTFDTAPDNGSALTADYVWGEPGRDWVALENRPTRDNGSNEPFGSDCREVILQNTGLSGRENIMIGIREWEYTTKSAAGWDLNGYLWHTAGMAWNANYIDHGRTGYDTTWQHYDYHPMLPLIDGTMYYWFYSNRQRIVVVVKVKSNYESAYLGFGRRFSPPSDYPYPLAVIGCLYGNRMHSDDGYEHAYIANPYYQYCNWVISPANKFRIGTNSGNGCRTSVYDFAPGTKAVCHRTSTDKVLLTPVYMYDARDGDVYFDLDGVLKTVGGDVQSEDTVTEGTKTYRVFQNIHRNAWHQFMAIRED